jgi:DHA2 family multidrug resistance protein
MDDSYSDMAGVFVRQTGDPVAAQQLAWQALESVRQQQASAFAYIDVFLMLTVVTLGLEPLAPLIKRSAARKFAHIAGE